MGTNVLAWIKAALAIAGVALLAFIAYQVMTWIKDKGGIGNALKASPLGLPARGIDAAITAVSGGAENGGESTLGGALARFREWVSGDSAKIDAMKAGTPTDRVKPTTPFSINPRDRE